MKIAIGSDIFTHLAQAVKDELNVIGHELTLFGAFNRDPESWLWPKIAEQVAREVSEGRCNQGVLFCWTGTGVAMAANKVSGIRAALCHDAESARGARLWNDANILVLSLRSTSEEIAKEIVSIWFATGPSSKDDDKKCLAYLNKLDNKS